VAEADLSEQQRAAVRLGTVEHIRTLLFDATTDLGIPVIYGLQLGEHDPVLAQLVTAVCTADPADAVVKVYREATSVRIALREMARGSRAYADESISVVAGALDSGRPDRRHRFDFLLQGDRPVHALDSLPRPPDTDPRVVLAWMLDRLRAAECEVLVVDITTDEARQAGAVVVRVIVPELMPVSFDRHARFLAHPRLYTAPARMGHPIAAEADLNLAPQPFA
jgi:ribosomal protein S12 methylthiotransferase accessory factor